MKPINDLAYVIECAANDHTDELKRELAELIDRIKSKQSGYDLPITQGALPRLEVALECYRGYRKELIKTSVLTGVSREWWNWLLSGRRVQGITRSASDLSGAHTAAAAPRTDSEFTALSEEKIATPATDMTDVFFGMVDRYIADRGFGFVKREFPERHGESYFFHIKTLKKARADLAISLEGGAKLGFWYCLLETQKGKKEAQPLTLAQLSANATFSSPLIRQVEALWSDSGIPPGWLSEVTRDLLGAERAIELKRQKDEADAARRRMETEQFELEESGRAARRAMEEAEFAALLAEMEPLGFRESREVSDYIVRNNLGQRYKKISGYVTMEREIGFGRPVDTWEFKGGFPPAIYRRLCRKLGLVDQGSGAKAVDFKSFEDS